MWIGFNWLKTCCKNSNENTEFRKSKIHTGTAHGGPEGEYRYNSTLSLTSALDGEGDQRHALAALPPGKDPVPIVWVAGWAPSKVWTGVENLAPPSPRDSIQ